MRICEEDCFLQIAIPIMELLICNTGCPLVATTLQAQLIASMCNLWIMFYLVVFTCTPVNILICMAGIIFTVWNFVVWFKSYKTIFMSTEILFNILRKCNFSHLRFVGLLVQWVNEPVDQKADNGEKKAFWFAVCIFQIWIYFCFIFGGEYCFPQTIYWSCHLDLLV